MTGKEYYSLLKVSPHNAHKAVFDEYCNYVYTVVFNHLRTSGSHEDIEECMSDVFADFYMSLENEKNIYDDLKGHIGCIAKRRAIDAYRSISAKKDRSILSIDNNCDLIDTSFDPEEKAEKDDLCRILINAVEELGNPCSDIIIQKFYFNRTSKEIAENMSMKASAVRMQCSRAMKRLRKILSELGITL